MKNIDVMLELETEVVGRHHFYLPSQMEMFKSFSIKVPHFTCM